MNDKPSDPVSMIELTYETDSGHTGKCMCASEPQNYGGLHTGGIAGLKPGEIPSIIQPSYDIPLELYKQIEARAHRCLRPPRYWYTRKIDHGTMIVCRLGREQDTDALELAHTLKTADLRDHYDARWLIRNAIEGLERNAARLPTATVNVTIPVSTPTREGMNRATNCFRLSPEGCNRPLRAGQWWSYCGESDMGQTLPALCTECGGEYKLAKD